jgi:hypothetical protein
MADKLKTIAFAMFGTPRRVNRLRFVKKIGFSLHINPHMIKKLLIFDTSGGLHGICA